MKNTTFLLFLLAFLWTEKAEGTTIDSLYGNMTAYNNPDQKFKRFIKASNITTEPVVKVYYDADHKLLKETCQVNSGGSNAGKWLPSPSINYVYVQGCTDG